ncbi:MAG: NAD(P)H-dependent oxidoreductase [Candidatus Doudnabacteria bacterium]|nr:NAD(P)H-dependent oxidoreductase [Candidatus Doudnabacteria bacterium]
MTKRKLFIPVLLGTSRQGRESEKVAKLIYDHISKSPEIETQLFDPRVMHLPQDDEDGGIKEQNKEWKDAIIRADGLIIVTPEYNHAFPGSLKRALDLLLPEYIHKAVGLVGVSAGGWGGVRAVEHLVQVVRELGLAVTFSDLYFPKVQDAFDDQGKPKDEKVYKRIDDFMTELIWMAKALKWGRENLPSKYHKK